METLHNYGFPWTGRLFHQKLSKFLAKGCHCIFRTPWDSSQTIFRHAGKIGLVNGLFRSCSLRQNVGGPIRLLCESDVIHGNNGDQEGWAIEAICRRLGYAGLKPAGEKAVRCFANSLDTWKLVNREWKVWMQVRLLQSLSLAERGVSFQDCRFLAIGTSREDDLCNDLS